MKKMTSESLNLTEEKLDQLKEILPEAFIEGDKIDFQKLRLLLGDKVETSKERYNFTWHGKKESMLGAQKPSKGTLRPDREKSKNFDTTENLYIEGDNLETLKLLQKSYNNKIDVIYIDPPYNTGNDFVYKDNFKNSVENYLEQTEQVDAKGNYLSTNSETHGRYHSNWLNMMYSRLKLARNLLNHEGVIFLSIDDNEMSRLKIMCDEVFGEENFLGTLIQNKQNSKNDALNIQKNHEYILCYRKKSITYNNNVMPSLLKKSTEKVRVHYDSKNYFKINDPITTRGDGGVLEARPNLGYTIYYHPSTEDMVAKIDYNVEYIKSDNEDKVYRSDESLLNQGYLTIRPPRVRGKLGAWTWDIKKFNREKKYIWIKKTSTGYRVHKRIFVDENDVFTENNKYFIMQTKYVNTRSILNYSTNEGSKVLNNILGSGKFNNPKNIEMIKYLLGLIKNKDALIMDFFSGSATTAHATMELNAEDGGSRKFMMVQLPEPLDEKSEAYKDGYRTICDIGEERIRRAGEKVKKCLIEKNNKEGLLEENQVDPDCLDIGFKVVKLDKSNIKEWNVDFDHLDQLDLYEDIFVGGRSELDIVYEILLKNGIELTYPITTFEVDSKQIYDVAYGNLFICLADNIDTSIAKAIADKRNEYAIETSAVVFKDAGFGGNDSEKLNVIEILKDADYTDDQLLTI